MLPLEQAYRELATQVLFAGLTKGMGVDAALHKVQELAPLILDGQESLNDALAAGDRAAATALNGAVAELEQQRDGYLLEIGKAAYRARRGSPETLLHVDRLIATPTAATTPSGATAMGSLWGLVIAGSAVAAVVLIGVGLWASGLLTTPASPDGQPVANGTPPASRSKEAPTTDGSTPRMASNPAEEPLPTADTPENPDDLLKFVPPPPGRVTWQTGLFAGELQAEAPLESGRGVPQPVLEAAAGDLVLTVIGRQGRVWDLAAGRAVTAFEIPGKYWNAVGVGLSADGKTLVAYRGNLVKGEGQATIRGYDPRTGKLRWKQTGDTETLPLTHGRIFGARLVTYRGNGGGLQAWNLADGSPISLPETTARVVPELRLTPDCPWLVLRRTTGSEWEFIDFHTGKLVHVLTTPQLHGVSASGSIAVVTIQERGRTTGVAGLDLTGDTPLEAWTVAGRTVSGVMPEQNAIVFGSGQPSNTSVHDLTTGAMQQTWPTDLQIGPSTMTNDGGQFLTGRLLLDRATGTLRGMLPVTGASVLSSSNRVVTLEPKGRVAVWNAAAVALDGLRQPHTVWTSNKSWYAQVAFSNDGTRLAAVDQHGLLRVYEIATSQALPFLTQVDLNSPAPRFVMGDSRIVGHQKIPVGNGSLMGWDVVTTQPNPDVFPLATSSRDIVHYLALSADGQTLAAMAAGEPRKLRFLSAATGATIGELGWPVMGLPNGHFSADGQTFGLSMSNGMLLYDVASLRLTTTLDLRELDPTGPQSSVCHLAPDGKTVWRSFDMAKSGGVDPNYAHPALPTVEVWNVATRQKERTLLVGAPVHQLVFLADDKTIASRTDDDATIRLWDRETGALKGLLIGHTRPIQSFDYHPATNRMVSVASDQTFRFWELNDLLPWDPTSSALPVELVEARPGSRPTMGLFPPGVGPGAGRPNSKAAPQPAPVELTPAQLAARQALFDQLPEGTLLRGEWSYTKYNGRIAYRITETKKASQELTAEAYDPAKPREAKTYTGRFEFDEEEKAWVLEWAAVPESGVRRTPSRIPVTTNLLLFGDQRTVRLKLLSGEWFGLDSTGASYTLKPVNGDKP